MAPTLKRTLIAALCLVSFVLHSTVLNGVLMLCRHADGTSCIELGPCADDEGNCESGCSDTGCEEAPPPCEDQPLRPDHQIAKLIQRTIDLPTFDWSSVVLGVAAWSEDSGAFRIAGWADVRGRPPDSLVYLRTVVLLV